MLLSRLSLAYNNRSNWLIYGNADSSPRIRLKIFLRKESQGLWVFFHTWKLLKKISVFYSVDVLGPKASQMRQWISPAEGFPEVNMYIKNNGSFTENQNSYQCTISVWYPKLYLSG